MKTKILLFGVLVAAISTLSITGTQAQSSEQPAIKVVAVDDPQTIKVIYGYPTSTKVDVRFIDRRGLILNDKIDGKTFEKGFMKKYKMNILEKNTFWVEVSSPEVSATYKMTMAKNGKWTSLLEKATYHYPAFALR